MMGINFINEMTREDLVHEILAAQRVKLLVADITELKVAVINLRVEATRDALVKEAGLKTEGGFFGTQVITDETSE